MSTKEEIELLKTNVERLLATVEDYRKQISILQTANEAQHEEIMRTHAELLELRKQYDTLRTAHAITAESEEREKAKRHITSMISKIDQTLFLLK